MDDAIMKTGQWPNVAVEAGSDPAEAMEEYGVEPHGLRTAAYEYEQRIAELEAELAAERATVAQPQERACRIVAHVTDGLMSGSPRRLFELSCGHSVMLAGLTDEPAFCAICGAVVVKPAGEQDTHERLEGDTRELLEAELRDEMRLVFGGNGGQRYASYKFVQSLLDRQAAITRRETRQSWQDAPCILDRENLRTIDRLTADAKRWADAANEQRLVAMEQADKVQELTAERDELRGAIDAMENGQFYAMYASQERDCIAMYDEIERLQGVVRTQAESFKGIEEELAAERSACNTLRASVAGLKGTVERQRDELAEARHAALGVWRALDRLFLSDGTVTKALVDEWRRKLAGAGIEAS